MANRREYRKDPFAGLRLDEAFVQAARCHEPSAAERGEQAVRPTPEQPAGRASQRRRPARRWWSLVPGVAVLLVGAVLVWSWRTGSTDGAAAAAAADPPVLVAIDGGDRPTPSRADSNVPLGAPLGGIPEGGPYRFHWTQPGGDEPVAYDPCRPIPVVVNEAAAPPGATAIVSQAITEMAVITGLQLTMEGSTDEGPAVDRPAFQPERYGDRWAPVLLAWTDPTEVPELAGAVTGVGGSVLVRGRGSAPAVYVLGIVLLDGPQAASMLGGGDAAVRALVLHELGHLLGLDHVEDDTQLMHDQPSTDVVELQQGDLAGLAELGRGPCRAEL